MSLMAWFRKNNKKLMAFVVIALMIVFTIQPVMDYLSARRSGGNRAIASYGDNKKITGQDRAWAQQQLEILRMLGADVFMRPQDPRYTQLQDLRTDLIGELLFAERSTAIETIGWIRQTVARGDYGISDKQINGIYERKYSPDIYWILLTAEARQAGVQVPVELAKAQLEKMIPQLRKGATYAQFIYAVVAKGNVTEDQVLETFADLLTIVEYGKMACSMQGRTAQQELYETALRLETMDIEYVLFDTRESAEQTGKPGEEKIVEQFNKYKGFFDGDVNEGNPYGFGYKLPDRVQFEYTAVRLDEIAATIPQPTQQETEEYYQQHLSQKPIAYAAPSDPNDPNSPQTIRTRSYAEVASTISRGLYQQRVDSKAEQILSDAKSVTEANMPEIDNEVNRPSDEQLKKQAVDYQKMAAELSDKYKLKVYAGKTGFLNAADIQRDTQLGTLYLGGAGSADVGLVRILFAVEQLKTSVLGPMDAKIPRFYENIGLLKDARESMQGYSGKNMMLVRIVKAEKAVEPQSVDEKLNKQTVRFDQQASAGEDGNSVREQVVEDLKKLAAMDKVKYKVSQFVKLVEKDGWDEAIKKYNKAHDDSNSLKPGLILQTRKSLERIPASLVAVAAIRYQGDPLGREMLARIKAEKMLTEDFYSLVPPDSNTLAGPATIVEYKPGMSYYCIKSLVIHRLFQGQFDRQKAREIVRDDFADGQVLAATHYNPENIANRMNFILIQEQKEPAMPAGPEEPNTPASPAGKI
jgi:hypothetical protein